MRILLRGILLVGAFCLGGDPGIADDAVIKSLQIHGTRRPLSLETRPGETLDFARVERDVRRLWSTGWFDDIQVVEENTEAGLQIVFELTERPKRILRSIRFEAAREEFQVTLFKGMPFGATETARVAAAIRTQLVDQGFPDARVEPRIIPVDSRSADLVLVINRGELYEFEDVRFTGEMGLEESELMKALASVRPRRILPPLGPLWGGWRLRAPYSQKLLDAEVGNVRSLYLSRGYLDARIGVEVTRAAKGKVFVNLNVDAGRRYTLAPSEIPPASKGYFLSENFCRCIHQARRESEKRGELTFAPRLEISPGGAAGTTVLVSSEIQPGPVFRVGRIEFQGHRVVNDSTLRKALPLQEGDLFDAGKLRRGAAQLNRIAPLQSVDSAAIRISPLPDRGLVNLTIPVNERPRGYWKVDGPLGPLSAFGPLNASIGSRLPAVGRGPLELSTYSLTFSVAAWPTALAGIAGFGASSAWGTVMALQRPYVPGQRWTSGILIAPQFGWRGTGVGYGVSRLTEAARAALGAESPRPPDISIPVVWGPRVGSDPAHLIPIGFVWCAPPKPRLAALRSVALTLLDSSTAFLVATALY